VGFGFFGYGKVTVFSVVVLAAENLPHRKKETLHLTSGLAKLGGEVIVRISVRPLTGGDYPNCVQLTPQLRQAAGTLAAMVGRQCVGQ